jgi:hypothetical protein
MVHFDANRARRRQVKRTASIRPGLVLAALAVFLSLAGWRLAPVVLDSWAWIDASDDPAALTDLGLKSEFTPDRLKTGLATALDADDVDLAASFMDLAARQGMTPPPELSDRYNAATTTMAMARRRAREFYNGLASGDAGSEAGLAGVVASDLTGVSDARDLIHEGGKIARGEEPDRLTLGLAALGLVVTGATIATLSATIPARAGLSTITVAVISG